MVSIPEGLSGVCLLPALTSDTAGYKKATDKLLAELATCSVESLDNPRETTSLVRALTPVIGAKHAGYEHFLAGSLL
jgi:hypothetical protein